MMADDREDPLLMLMDAASATAEQRFSLMLHDRIVKLEADNARLMAHLFPPPDPAKIVPEFARPLLKRLKGIDRQHDQERHRASADAGRELIPSDVLADIPADAMDKAIELVKMTQSSLKYFSVFYQAIRLIQVCGAKTTQRMVEWIETVVADNLAKLDGSPRPLLSFSF